jgi:stress-induced morphogen
MADLAEIERMIAEALPGAEVEVVDETGGGDHLRARVRASQFEGKSRIDQHRLVRAAVQPRMDDGSIHALSIQTMPAASSASRPGPPGPGTSSR